MPAAADWITLAEAAEILAAANVKFRPETIGAWARIGQALEHQARRQALRPAGRGQGAARGPAPGRAPRTSSPACSRTCPDAMSDDRRRRRPDRLRALATRVVETLGGIPAVRTLVATLEVYDRAGGGLTASGPRLQRAHRPRARAPCSSRRRSACSSPTRRSSSGSSTAIAARRAAARADRADGARLGLPGRGADDRHRVHRPAVGIEPLLRLARLRVLEGVPRRAAPERGRAHAARRSS